MLEIWSSILVPVYLVFLLDPNTEFALLLCIDIFSNCYESSESRSFVLLKKKSVVWEGTTCLKMAMEADARLFFSHDGVQVSQYFIFADFLKGHCIILRMLEYIDNKMHSISESSICLV